MLNKEEFRTSPDLRRKIDPNTGQEWEAKALWESSHEMVRLAFLGWRNTEIAERLGVDKITVSNTINSTLGQKKLQLMHDARDADVIDVADKIAELAPKAVDVYRRILEEDDAKLSLKKNTADTILKDILGYQAPKKIEGKFAHAHLGEEDISRIKERSLAAAAAAGVVIDA